MEKFEEFFRILEKENEDEEPQPCKFEWPCKCKFEWDPAGMRKYVGNVVARSSAQSIPVKVISMHGILVVSMEK